MGRALKSSGNLCPGGLNLPVLMVKYWLISPQFLLQETLPLLGDPRVGLSSGLWDPTLIKGTASP